MLILVEHEVIFSYLSLDLVTIFTSRGWEPLLVELSLSPSFIVQEFCTNIHDISGSTFRAFLWDKTIKITPDASLVLFKIPGSSTTYSHICLLISSQLILLFALLCLTAPWERTRLRSVLGHYPLIDKFC